MRLLHSVLTPLLGAAAIVVAGTGCHRGIESDVSPKAVTSVRIVNNNFSDMKIYVEGTGNARMRLGTVVGETSATFRLPQRFVAFGNVEVTGIPIGGFGSARSGSIEIAPGQLVVFTLQADLAMSSATVELP